MLTMMGFYMLHLLHVNQSLSSSAFVWPRTQIHGNIVAEDLRYQQGFEAGERKTTTQSKFAAHAQQAYCHKSTHCAMFEPVQLPHQCLLSPSSSVNEHVSNLMHMSAQQTEKEELQAKRIAMSTSPIAMLE